MSRVEELEKQIQELEKELAVEKRKAEVLYLIQKTEDCWKVHSDGCISKGTWDGYPYEKNLYAQGNVFNTQEEAEKERDRRILLTRFRQFRDKCNGDWKPDFEDWEVNKYYLAYSYVSNKLCCFTALLNTHFQLFGYFKNKEDANSAIELFGDEIKRLWVDE